MINNDALPGHRHRPGDLRRSTIDGELVTPAPADRLPLAQLYSLF